MARFKMVDGVKTQLTSDEEKARDAEEKVWADAAPARAFEALRRERDGKLAETDFYALSDVTLSDEMKKYRADLRDLPSKYDDSTVVKTITWPSKP
mgnify:FL=1